MKQEEKDLLLKDLCGRLPYGVKVRIYNHFYDDFFDEFITIENISAILERFDISDIKPYLFPLSSMTDEQKNDCPIGETNLNIIKSNIGYGIIEIPYKLSYIFIEWCNKNNFDYRGLIPMKLAIDATGLNIY